MSMQHHIKKANLIVHELMSGSTFLRHK